MIPASGGRSPAAEMARRNSEKAQIQDIKQRFSNYIRHVKSMRNQMTQADGSSAFQRLQEEMVAIRNMYEQEIGNLREKLEQNYREQSRGGIDSHRSTLLASEYQSRLWEMNRDVLKKDEEIQALQLVVAQQESDIQSLKGSAVSPSIQLELARQEHRELQRNLLMAQTKYEEEFSQRSNLQDQLVELTHHIEDLKQIHMKESQELRAQVAQSEVFVLQLEDKLRTVSRGGPALMETVQKIQEASEAEVKRLQDETESVYHQSLMEIQMRLNNDQILLGRAQEENQRLHRRGEELTNEVTSLEKKLFSEETNNRTLMEKLEAEHVRGLQHIRALEARLEEMQDLLLAKMKELNTFQETNVSLRNELDALKSMLEEEEQQMSSSQLTFSQTPSSSWYPLANSFQSSVPNLLADYTKTSEVLSPLTASDPIKLTTTSEGNYSSKGEKTEIHSQTERFRRPFSEPPLSVRIPDRSNRETSLLSVTDSADPQHASDTPSSTDSDIKTAVSSATRDLEITDVHPSGNFVRIINRSLDKEEDIGGYLLQQNIRGHPVSIYRFPPKTRIMASTTVTVWASAACITHNPPTDLLWKEQSKFVTEPRCTTILCTPKGQAVAWITPLGDKMRKSSERYDVFEPEPKILLPLPVSDPSHVDEVPTNGGKSKSLKSPPAHHRLEKVPRLLKREKIPPTVLPATSSPWTQSTASPTHPDFTPSRPLPPGNDGSSLCGQTRSHTAKTAPPSAGAPSTGPRNGRDPSVSQGSKRSRGPTRSAGARKGTLRLLLPGSFSPLSDQHQAGLQILQTVQNLHFQPPMPHPPPLTSW